MIQQQDLRIGNYIEQGKIFEIKQNVVRVKYKGRTSLLVFDELKPINLTEEILLKCGFRPYGEGRLYHDELSLHEADFIFNSKSDRIKYLHEIQNLFCALTGTELTIKWL